MNKTFASALFASAVIAVGPGQATGYAEGVPPTTQNCNGYPLLADGNGNFDAQSVAWGLVVDREFGGCKCADDDAEFNLAPYANNVSNWSCKCLNTDTYPNMPSQTQQTVGGKLVLNDTNGKICGVIAECRNAAIQQQQSRWNQEVARASKTKDASYTHARRYFAPIDSEFHRSRTIRNKMTFENRIRSRLQIGSLAHKYRSIKNSFVSGGLDKLSFEKGYGLTSQGLSRVRSEWSTRQADINNQWNMVLGSHSLSENLVSGDIAYAQQAYEQTLASLADRYGKRIAYYQSLPVVLNIVKRNGDEITTLSVSAALALQQNSANCALYEDGMSY